MLSLIAAVASNGAIGKDNAMLWRLPGDLAYFKSLTTGKAIIMGRKTFESLPGVLPNRRHIVITTQPSRINAHPGVETAASLGEAIKKAPCEAFIIGGARIYREALPLCERLYITEVGADYDADTFFPPFDRSCYEQVSCSAWFRENGVDYRFVVYQKNHRLSE